MGGYCYGEPEPIEKCPYCGTECRADFCDVGVGMVQVGPFHCDECHASEIGPYDERRELTERERKAGWYAPGAEPGSSANVIGGRIVGHVEMKDAYQAEFCGNPLWRDEAHVAEWWRAIRQP